MFGRISHVKYILLCFLIPIANFSEIVSLCPEQYNTEFITKLAAYLIRRNRIESIVTFASRRETDQLLAAQNMTHSLEHEFDIWNITVPIIVCRVPTDIKLWQIVNEKTLVFVTIYQISPRLMPMLDMLCEVLDKRHHVFLLFTMRVLRHSPPTLRQLREFFDWCWHNNFVNVAITFQYVQYRDGTPHVHNELFTYTPFPHVAPINVTHYGTNYPWTAFDAKNVYGYEFYIPVFQDVPASFLQSDGTLKGIAGTMVVNYIKRINGRVRTEALPKVNRNNFHLDTLLAASRRETDIGVHPYSALTMNANLTDGVFTFSKTQTCLLVPWNRKPQLEMFIEISYQVNKCCFFFLLIFLPLLWQLTARKGLKGIYLVFVVYYLQPLEGIVFRRFPRAYKIVHISLLMGIFLLRNMRSADLSASFSVQQLGPQIETIKDFMETPLRIMVTKEEAETIFERNLLPAVLRERLFIVSMKTRTEHHEKLNTSYAYLATSAFLNLIEIRQRNMQKPPLRIVKNLETCTPPFFIGLPVQWNSPFKESFFNFYLYTMRSGLQKRWVEKTRRYFLRVHAPQISEPAVAPLDLRDFEFCLWMIAKLLGACILVLFIEILWKRIVDTKKKYGIRCLNINLLKNGITHL